jgi:DNA (cytosine-5)-methyltransferase 1
MGVAAMTLVSLFAGIGGFDRGFELAGFRTVGQCEIDPHARSVLERHWPTVPKHDDVTTLTAETFGPADVVTFGSPCQDLSVAGKRAGLDGERSGLFLEAVRYIREMLEATHGRYPRVALWENVPGAYSSNGGLDFAAVLESLVGGDVRRPPGGWPNAGVAFGPLGGAEWRTLDSQYFGVPQRRRRIFLVYHPGGERAGQILLEPDSLPGNPPQGREAGESVTRGVEGGAGIIGITGELTAHHDSIGTLERGSPSGGGNPSMVALPLPPLSFVVRGDKEGGGKGYLGSEDRALTLDTTNMQTIAQPVAYVASDYSTGQYRPSDVAEALTTSVDRTRAAPIAFAVRGREDGAVPEVSGDQTSALRGAEGGSSRDYVATIQGSAIGRSDHHGPAGPGWTEGPAFTLDTKAPHAVATTYAVRRLTPRECCRLQGFPDDHTRYDAAGREIADTHRYRMLGNAVTVNTVQWIANRIKQTGGGEA